MAICSGVFMKIYHLHILHVFTFHLWGKTHSVERKREEYTIKDNLKEDFTILSSFYIRFCHFRVLKIDVIAGRKLRLVKLTSKCLKIP